MADRKYVGKLYMVQLALLDAAGYAAGLRGTAWANNETSAAMVLDGRRSSSLTYSNPQTDEIGEGGEVVGVWVSGGTNLNQVDIALSDDDPDLDALIGNTLVSTTAPSSHYQFSTEEENHANRPALCVILTQETQGPDGIDGAVGYKHRMIPVCKAFVQDGDAPFQGGSTRTLRLFPLKTNKTPFGLTVSQMNMGVNGGKVSSMKTTSDNPVHLVSYKKDGTATTFTTTYKPISSSVDSDTGPNMMTEDGAVTDPTTIVPATGVVTIPAGSGGEKVVLLMEHQEETV